MKFIIGNWKANKTAQEAFEWMLIFTEKLKTSEVPKLLEEDKLQIIIAPPFPFIYLLQPLAEKFHNLVLASQDISQFSDGSFTGEVTAQMVKGVIDYSIIGHSERRVSLYEDEATIAKKMKQLEDLKLKSILCVRDEKDTIYSSASLVAYEPMDAIGTGNNKTVEEVIAMKKNLSLLPHQKFIYGGSVNEENCTEYLQNPEIDGLLPGKASLDPVEFFSIVSSVE